MNEYVEYARSDEQLKRDEIGMVESCYERFKIGREIMGVCRCYEILIINKILEMSSGHYADLQAMATRDDMTKDEIVINTKRLAVEEFFSKIKPGTDIKTLFA